MEEGTEVPKKSDVELWRKKFSHKGIAYEIAMIDHMKHFSRPMNKIGKHVVLEYPQETEEFVAKTSKFSEKCPGLDEFLFRDTLHAGQENWSEEQMIEQMHSEAKESIDALHSCPAELRKKAEICAKELIEQAKEIEKELLK